MNNESNPFALAAHESQAVAVAQSRAAQEIQAGLVVAKKFPRDQNFAYQQIMEACKRRGLAEEATYVYPRGGTTVSGASIRLLEVIAQCWGNFNCGVIELEQTNGESQMMAYAWDLQTNFYDSKTFVVPHDRKSAGKVERLTDPRDIYEHTANLAARRKRSCMEAVIPRDIIDDAVAQCEKTLRTNAEPIADRIRKMVIAFADFGVTVQMMEKRLGHKLDAAIEQELVALRKIYTSLKDSMSKREDWFSVSDDISSPKFDAPKNADEKAESAAGLAPVDPSAPADAAPARRGRQKKQEAAATSSPTPASPPAQASAPAPTAPVAAAPAPTTPTAQSSFSQLVTEPYNQLRTCMTQSGITDEELIQLCRHRGVMTAQQEELMQLSDDTMRDIVASWTMIAGQIRQDRKRTK